MSDEITDSPVLRVTQLDTNELNESLLLSLRRSLNEDYFKYIQLKQIQRYHVEIFAGLKFILWYHTYGKSAQTVGQSIFDWSYVFDNKTRRALLVKKIIHACVFCLDEWFEVKILRLLKRILKYVLSKVSRSPSSEDTSSYNQTLNRAIDTISKLYKSLSFLNYILFLINGKYLKLWERIFSFRPVYNNPQYMVQSNMSTDVSIREELWQTYFSLFRLSNSLFDFQKLVNIIKKKNSLSEQQKNALATDEIDIMTCGICKKEPITVHRSQAKAESQCQHVFCYSCIKQAVAESGQTGYTCTICFRSVCDVELFTKS